MSQRRTLILVAAIAIGGLASFLVWNYVNGIQDEAYSGAERVPVYLVKTQVSRGTTGTEAMSYIVKENIPRKFKPSNAIANLEDISGKVALSNLVPNQVVVSDMFVDAADPRAAQSFAERLTKIRGEDMVAISVNVDTVHGVAGLLQPGDYVNVMLTNSGGESSGDSTDSGTSKSSTASVLPSNARYLYQKVRILAIDKSAAPQPGDAAATTADGAAAAAAPSADSGLLTLIVPAKGAQYFASVSPGSIYLSLVARDYKPVPMDILSANDPLPGEDGAQLTPYGPKGAESEN